MRHTPGSGRVCLRSRRGHSAFFRRRTEYGSTVLLALTSFTTLLAEVLGLRLSCGILMAEWDPYNSCRNGRNVKKRLTTDGCIGSKYFQLFRKAGGFRNIGGGVWN